MRDADSGVYITVDSISETPEPHPRVSPSRSRREKSAKAAPSALTDIGRAAAAPRAWFAATL
jgi:hypothetical protein